MPFWVPLAAAGISAAGSFLSSKSRGKAPSVPPYYQEPYANVYGERAVDIDRLGYDRAKEYFGSKPGLTEAERYQIVEHPIELSKLEDQAAIRKLNRTAAGGGWFASGGRAGGEGQIRSRGARTRAYTRQRGEAFAANFAREDRLRQLGALNQYVLPRQQIQQGNVMRANQYNLGRAGIQTGQWSQADRSRSFDLGNFFQMYPMAGKAIEAILAAQGGRAPDYGPYVSNREIKDADPGNYPGWFG